MRTAKQASEMWPERRTPEADFTRRWYYYKDLTRHRNAKNERTRKDREREKERDTHLLFLVCELFLLLCQRGPQLQLGLGLLQLACEVCYDLVTLRKTQRV